MRLGDLWRNWNEFFFRKDSPLPMAVYRILLGLHILTFAFLIFPDLKLWYLPDGMISIPTIVEWQETKRASLLWLLPQTPESVYALFCLLVVSATTMTLGFFTRTSAALVAIALISFHHRNGLVLNSSDMILRLSALLVMMSPAGNALSIDSWLRRKNVENFPTLYPIWAQRILQLQVTMIYADSFLSKLDGATWINGTAVYLVTRHLDTQKVWIPFLFENIWICALLTWGTLIIECGLCTLVWIKELRYYVLAAGVLLHLGIEVTMNIPIFETIMISMYIVFVEPKHIQMVLNWLQERLRLAQQVEKRSEAGPKPDDN